MEATLLFFGDWVWIAFALILLTLEIVLPSTFLLWPALAALLVGLVTLVHGVNGAYWPWQAQVVVFLFLSLVAAYVGRDWVKKNRMEDSDQPLLNETAEQLVGKTAVVTSPIVHGTGRAKLGDTTWAVTGPDMDAGARVEIVRYEDGQLLVRAAG